MPDIPLEDRVDAAFRPNKKLSARLASLDARHALEALLRRLAGTAEGPSTWRSAGELPEGT